MVKFSFAEGKGNSYFQCLRWMYFVIFHTGCLSFSLPQDNPHLTRWNAIYTNFIRLLLFSGFFGGLLVKLTDAESFEAMFGRMSPVLRFVLVYECILSTTIYAVVSLFMQSHKKMHMELGEKIDRLDRRMQEDFPQINWNYHKSMRKFTTFTFTICSCYIIGSLAFIVNLVNCRCGYMSTVIIALSYAALTTGPGCVGFVHISLMDVLRIRFRLFQKLFHQYYITQGSSKHPVSSAIGMVKVKNLMDNWKCYSELILDINNIFSFVCAACFFYDFGVLTDLVFLICHYASEGTASPKDYTFILLFMIFRVYKVLMTAVYGYAAAKERSTCLHFILTCDHYFPCSKMREALGQFLQWKMHNNYHLNIGKSIKASIIVAFMVVHGITNYTIILIQLQLQHKNIKNTLNNIQ